MNKRISWNSGKSYVAIEGVYLKAHFRNALYIMPVIIVLTSIATGAIIGFLLR